MLILRLGLGRPVAAIRIILAVTLLNALSYSIILPVLPNLMKALSGGDIAAASQWHAALGTLWGGIQLFCSPLLGAVSDRVGRRPVLLLSLFGLGADFLIMAFAPNLWWLVAGRALNAMTASTTAVAGAYIADVTPADARAEMFGWMGAAASLGFLAGPALGGALAEVGLRMPFMLAGGLTALNWVWGLFVLSESLPAERRARSLTLHKANPFASLAFLKARGDLIGLAAIGFLGQAAYLVGPTVFVLYGAYRYGWGPGMAGGVLMASAGLGLFVQAVLVGPVVARFGERGAVLAGAAFGTIGFALIGVASTGWQYFAAMPAIALVGLLSPGLMGLMTRHVAADQQGTLQGSYQSLLSLAAIAGPITYGLVFAAAIQPGSGGPTPGMPYFIASGLLALAFALALRHAPHRGRQGPGGEGGPL